MINLNISEKDLQNANSIAKVVSTLLYIKVCQEEGNWDKCKENHNYYQGLEPVINISRDNGKFVPRTFNLAKPIVDIATKTFIGEEPDIITSGKKQEKEKITTFTQKLSKRHFHKEVYSVGKNSSIYGYGFLALYNETGDSFPRFKALNPQFADVVYDCTLSHKPILAFNIVENINRIAGHTPTENYIVYVYTKEKLYAFETKNRHIANAKQPTMAKDFVKPLFAFTSGNDLVSEVYHNFNDIPIVEFANNEELSGDFDCVKQLISAYNDLQNNRFINVDDVVNFVLFLKNVRVGDKEQANLLVDMLKEHRILPVEGDNVDARFLTNQLDQNALQSLAKDVKQNIDEISRVPNLSGIDFSQNASEPIIKIKTKPLLDLCNEKELFFTEPYIKVLELILGYCKDYDKKEYSTYDFNIDLVNIEYSHELPSNDLDMITQIANLSNARLVNPESALQHISWIKNVPNYIKGMEKYNDSVDKREKEKQNDITKTNPNNEEKEKSKLVSKDQMDNQKNYTQGLSNK